MLRKWNRILSFILAIALVATTFNSDLATVRVFADDDVVQDAGDAQPQETVEEEPVVEEPAAEPEIVEAEQMESSSRAEDPSLARLREQTKTTGNLMAVAFLVLDDPLLAASPASVEQGVVVQCAVAPDSWHRHASA